jgi:hypothetical protein
LIANYFYMQGIIYIHSSSSDSEVGGAGELALMRAAV